MIDIINFSQSIDQFDQIINDRDNIVMCQNQNIFTCRLVRKRLNSLKYFFVNGIRKLLKLRLSSKIFIQICLLYTSPSPRD